MPKDKTSTSQYSSRSLMTLLRLAFAAISFISAGFVFLVMVGVMQWVEDQVSLRNLEQAKPYVGEALEQSAGFPLTVSPTVIAYSHAEQLPDEFKEAAQFPSEYQTEIHSQSIDYFVYKTKLVTSKGVQEVYIISLAQYSELTDVQWQRTLLFCVLLMSVLFVILNTVATKVLSPMIKPINQLSDQLQQHPLPDSFTISSRAVTEFGILTDSLNQYRENSEQRIKQEQAFARYASHELRTPLSIVRGAAVLLGHNQEQAFQQKQRERIVRASQDMQNTVDALLHIVKQENPNSQAQPRLLEAQELEQILSNHMTTANQRGISLKLDIQTTPHIIPSEAVLKMLLGNLIQNAINALTDLEQDNKAIEIIISENAITVSDNGHGLSHNEHNQTGHGLGLVIVDTLCQRYQWQFQLKPNEPQGCVAELSF
ncbi:HAMP domain-containing histidine kinase [Shewanella maritima]|uniref:histidine kinase n=1 Tax=Shewanella maritima TaxID=2520507 RepID=A0A411PDB2_9GAMM|nr:HAMP domain-containing sensor histidine kinase [Shewanella maritima]QBF81511.1 HAMP domain-containing histidine kinase [Shewanella maritima]